jgi:transposase
VLSGIFWVLRSGAPWRDLLERYGPRTTCYNRFVRWRKEGVRDRLVDAITAARNRDIQMSDRTSVRAHPQAATARKGDAGQLSAGPQGLERRVETKTALLVEVRFYTVRVQRRPDRKRCVRLDPCDSSFQTGNSNHALRTRRP